jgi:hypothetical protein
VGLAETMVCESHAPALKGGERYVYKCGERDLHGAGRADREQVIGEAATQHSSPFSSLRAQTSRRRAGPGSGWHRSGALQLHAAEVRLQSLESSTFTHASRPGRTQGARGRKQRSPTACIARRQGPI